jgi:hypothetical protein
MQQQLSGETNKLFIWGIILAFIPSIGLLLGVFNGLRGISNQNATGLGAVAGGFEEAFVTTGALAAILLPIIVIVMLIKSLSGSSSFRKFVSVVSIGWCALLLVFCVASLWTVFIIAPKTTGH